MAAEFILPLKVDIAAAKMPEINNPTIPTGNWVKYTTENSIAVRNTDTQILRIHLVIGIKRSAYKEENQCGGNSQYRIGPYTLPCLFHRRGSEIALHHTLVRPIGGKMGKTCGNNDSPHRSILQVKVRRSQIELTVATAISIVSPNPPGREHEMYITANIAPPNSTIT